MRLTACLAALLALTAFLTPPAWAEGEEHGQDQVSKEIQEQMDKIIRLMEENEAALLTLSTGGKARPKPVDVGVPPAEGTNASGSGGEGDPQSRGQEAAEKLEELMKQQRSTGGKIPGALEELVRMVPM